MSIKDPTTVRLSEHFLLSDFMGCHSVYTKGYRNIFDDGSGALLAEGEYLCNELLEPLVDSYGPASIAYGFVSHSLSQKIVKYQDPSKPSYHRWDKGAAADVCFHYPLESMAPVELAHAVDESGLPYSRMISYAESPYLCLATQLNEGDQARKAFYENRYLGVKGGKPSFIKKAANPKLRAREGSALELPADWRGEGYPTYHGGGVRQMQHIRTSRYTMVSDFLYSTRAVSEGIVNAPNVLRSLDRFYEAGAMYDELLEVLDVPRLSVVRAFESLRVGRDELFSWADNFAIDFIPPSYISAGDVADAAIHLDSVTGVSVDNQRGVARVVGKGFLA